MSEISISVSLGSLFFMRELEEVLQNEGLERFKDAFEALFADGEFLQPGPSLGLVRYLSGIQGVKLSLISKLSANPDILVGIARSIDHYFKGDLGLNEFEQVIFCSGSDTVKINKDLGVDLAIMSNESAVTSFTDAGIAAIAIDTPYFDGIYDKEVNAQNYLRSFNGLRLISDFDGVIGDSSSERVFQKAISTKVDRPEIEFAKHEYANVNTPLNPGPMKAFVKMISDHALLDSRSSLHIVTARGGRAIQRAVQTLKYFGISADQVWFMAGQNKNIALNAIFSNDAKDALTLFLDDSNTHYSRSRSIKDVVSGLVGSDLHAKK